MFACGQVFSTKSRSSIDSFSRWAWRSAGNEASMMTAAAIRRGGMAH
jgi:hypothetical protein